MNLADICTREIVAADAAATLQQAAGLMRARHVGTLLVTKAAGGAPEIIGIVTDRDIVVEAVARGLDPARAEIGPVASPALVALPASAALGEAIGAMKERGVRRLLVCDDQGAVQGIVSLDDVLGALGHEMAELAHALRRGLDRETKERTALEGAPPARPLHIPAYAYV